MCFGDRQYWAFTNAHGQLVRVIADEIILQDDSSEPVNLSCPDFSDSFTVDLSGNIMYTDNIIQHSILVVNRYLLPMQGNLLPKVLIFFICDFLVSNSNFTVL